jgi:tRNA (mo5U34)-methyltransferase
LDREELVRLAQSHTWVHSIDCGDGYITPGLWGPGNPEIMKAMDQIDFRNKKVLDVGCWDGQWTFEAEKRGAAEVIAIDLVSQREFASHKTFEVAAALRGSAAKYRPDLSVYDVCSL